MFNPYNIHPPGDSNDDQELPHMFQHLLSLMHMHIQAQEIEAQEIKAQETETLERWFALSPEVN